MLGCFLLLIKVPIKLNSDRPLFPCVHSVDVSENPYMKSFKPGSKPTSYGMNGEIKTVSFGPNKTGKEQKAEVQDCVLNSSKTEETTNPTIHCE